MENTDKSGLETFKYLQQRLEQIQQEARHYRGEVYRQCGVKRVSELALPSLSLPEKINERERLQAIVAYAERERDVYRNELQGILAKNSAGNMPVIEQELDDDPYLPHHVVEAAAIEQLGPFVSSDRVIGGCFEMVCGVFWLAVTIVTLVVLRVMYTLPPPPYTYGDTNVFPTPFDNLASISVVTLFVSLTVYCFFYTIIYHSWRIDLFEDGFVFSRWKKHRAFRWDQIAFIKGGTVIYVEKGWSSTRETGRRRTKYIIQDKSGNRCVLTGRFIDIENSAQSIQQGIATALWPHVFAEFDRGQTISFEYVAVKQAGISAGGQPFLNWKQIQEIQLQNGEISIYLQGKRRPYFTIPAKNVPNANLLLSLSGHAHLKYYQTTP
ncbi:MAG TPA: DUF6585 family protein [Ktedonobacteraceae bacterium]|nr:DUF6585 family protein [Ktedonobacteraceae bacterium]